MTKLFRVFALLLVFASCITHATPLEITTHENVVYLADSSSTNVVRYSLATKSFLSPVVLSQAPLAIHADSTGIFASYGTRIVRLGLDGTGEADFRNISNAIYDIESSDKWLVLSGGSYLQVLNKSNGAFVSSKDLWYTSSQIGLSPNNIVYTTSSGISPADIYRIPLGSTGEIGLASESPYHGSYGVGENAQAFPTQNRVIDSSGNVYNALDLTYAGSLGGFYTALGFWRGLPVVLRDSTLYSYNSALLETGRHSVNSWASDLVVYQDEVALFGRSNPVSPQVEWVDISAITSADPVAPIDPTDLAYDPDTWVLDADGDTLYLLSKSQLNIFRWSISQASYLESIPLANAPQEFAYDAMHKRIYLSYSNGAINYIDLATNQEKVFANLGSVASAMVVAGDYLVAKGQTGAWGSFSVYHSSGLQTDYVDWIAPINYLTWDPVSSGIYYITGWSPSDLEWIALNELGEFGSKKSSPYHGDFVWIDPIRVSENGRFIAVSSGGVVTDFNLLGIHSSTNTYYKDITWMQGNLFTLLGVDNNLYTRVDRRNADFTVDASAMEEFFGEPVGLVALPARNQLLAIYKQSSKPTFTLINAAARDSDGDGVLDEEDLYPSDPLETLDFDRDGQGNRADLDDDSDGVNDVIDAFPLNPAETLDTDGDGQGNNADLDDDGDSVTDNLDSFPLDPTEQSDLDRDGRGDNSDLDRDGDGVANSIDMFPNDSKEWADTDGDGKGNFADDDDDNDKVLDAQDFYPLDATKSVLTAADFLPMAKTNRWVFDASSAPVTVGGDKKIAGQTISPLNLPSGGRFYMKTLNNQIQFFGVFFSSVNTEYGTFSTDILFDKGVNLLSSGTYSGKGDIVISPTYGKRNLSWNAQVQYLGSESISVPAGQYPTLHTRINFTAFTTIEGVQFQIGYSADYWFADNVGLVKINESGFEMELVSASVTKESTGSSGSSGEPQLSGGGGGGSLGIELLALLVLLTLIRREKISE